MNNSIYHVSFPKLGIALNINPIMLQFGSISLHWYGAIIAFSFLLGFTYVNKNSRKFAISSNDASDFTITSALFGIFFARIYYILFFPGDFYKKNPIKILMIFEGGIAIYGAIIGGLLGAFIIARVKRKNILTVLDLLAPAVAIGQCVGRWGNFVNQEAFGTPTDLPWGMASEQTLFETVHPCFLYESLGCFAIFLILHYYCVSSKNRKPGKIFLLYMMLYALLRAPIEGLRTDSLIFPHTNLRVSQIFAILLFIISLAIISLKNIKKSFRS